MKPQAVTSFRGLSFVVIIWGTNWLAIKNVLLSSPPLFFTGICLLGGAIAIGAVRLSLGYPLQRGFEGKGRLAVVGLLQLAGGFGLCLVGLRYFDGGTGVLVFCTMPLWLVTLEWASDPQMQSHLDVIALTCSVLGVGMLASGSIPMATSHGILGLALLSMAAFNWALGVWIRNRTSGDVWNRTVFQLTTAGAIVIVASLLLERRLDWTELPVLAWPLAFNLIVATGLAFVAGCRAFGISSRVGSQSLVLIPVVALIAAAVLQRESSMTGLVVACVLMMVGISTAMWRSKAPVPVNTISTANGSEHQMEPGDVGCDTSLSPDEDRRRGRPCGFVHRRPEPVYRSGDSCGATGASRAHQARLRDGAGVLSQAHKA